jgi:hypothetical protein
MFSTNTCRVILVMDLFESAEQLIIQGGTKIYEKNDYCSNCDHGNCGNCNHDYYYSGKI